MQRRTLILATIAVTLGVLVAYDHLGNVPRPEIEGRPAGEQPALPSAAQETPAGLQHWLALSKAEGVIEQAYIAAAIPYAEMAALLKTFTFEAQDPREVLTSAIQQSLPTTVEVSELLVGEAESVGPGVYALDAQVSLRAHNGRDALEALWALGEPAYGLTWRRFSLHADPKERRIDLSGELSAVVVHAAE